MATLTYFLSFSPQPKLLKELSTQQWYFYFVKSHPETGFCSCFPHWNCSRKISNNFQNANNKSIFQILSFWTFLPHQTLMMTLALKVFPLFLWCIFLVYSFLKFPLISTSFIFFPPWLLCVGALGCLLFSFYTNFQMFFFPHILLSNMDMIQITHIPLSRLLSYAPNHNLKMSLVHH